MTHHNLTFMIMVHELRGFAPEMMICCCSTIMKCTAMKDVQSMNARLKQANDFPQSGHVKIKSQRRFFWGRIAATH